MNVSVAEPTIRAFKDHLVTPPTPTRPLASAVYCFDFVATTSGGSTDNDHSYPVVGLLCSSISNNPLGATVIERSASAAVSALLIVSSSDFDRCEQPNRQVRVIVMNTLYIPTAYIEVYLLVALRWHD